MFGWLESLVKNPFSEDDSAPVMPGEPCPSSPLTLASPSVRHRDLCCETLLLPGVSVRRSATPQQRAAGGWSHDCQWCKGLSTRQAVLSKRPVCDSRPYWRRRYPAARAESGPSGVPAAGAAAAREPVGRLPGLLAAPAPAQPAGARPRAGLGARHQAVRARPQALGHLQPAHGSRAHPAGGCLQVAPVHQRPPLAVDPNATLTAMQDGSNLLESLDVPHHIALEGSLLEARFQKAGLHLSAWL